jgi:hypothetical protein
MPDLISGMALNQLFYEQIVAPILRSHFPELEYSAALIGWGSDVLGYDDHQSTDHNWGVRFQLFLSERDYDAYLKPIHDVLDHTLPSEFHGYPLAFELVGGIDPRMEYPSRKHNIHLDTIRRYFGRYLGRDPFGEIGVVDWLTFAEHKLLAVTSGRVFHDGLAKLEPVRRRFAYYPDNVWLYMLAAQWEKILEEPPFVGRCGAAGDELGSMLIAARQVKNLMKLCFLMERKYAPYTKWFGTAFGHLACAAELRPILMSVLQAQDWKARQEFLARAYEAVARMHNALGVTSPMKEAAVEYYNRPYLVVGDERYVEELRKSIKDDEVRNIKHRLGSLNQFVDSNDQLNNLDICRKLKAAYL